MSGQSCWLHLTGGVMLADTPERMDFLRLAHAKGRYLGMDTELITPSRSQGDVPADGRDAFRRRACGTRSRAISIRPAPPSPMPRRRKKLGAEIVLRNRGRGADAGAGRHLERHHRAGHGAGRACRQLRRPVGARGRPHGRRRAAGARHGAHVSADRADAGGRSLQQGDRPRDDRRARLQGRDLHRARSATASCSAPTRRPASRGRRSDDALGFRPRAAAARPRPHRAVAGGRLQAFPGIEKAGIKQVDQRPLHLRAGRQPAGRAGAGPDQLLGAPAASWPASARAAASGWRCPTGWSTAIRASTSGAWTSPAAANGRRLRYTNAKVRENYSRRFSIRFPNEELPAARPAQTTPLYDTMVAQNAVMGDTWGLETPLWFAPKGSRAQGRRLVPPLQRFRACRQRGARGARAASASPRSPTSPNTR